MKQFYFTPGPSQLYFTVDEHIRTALKENVPSISHRGKAFQSIYQSANQNIRELLSIPDDYRILFTASATEVWERSIENLVEYESFHFVNGSFSKRYYEISQSLNRKALKYEAEHGSVADVSNILIPESVELIAMTHNETSTGASHQVQEIYNIRSAFPDQILALDVVSSVPYVNLDYSQVDMAYFSVQKCFGLPAGLGVWIVNEKCIAKSEQLKEKGLSVGSYHSLSSLLEKDAKNQTPETPNVLNIYLLGKVAQDMLTKGLDQIRRETDYKAAVLYNTIEQSNLLSPFVNSVPHQSKTTVVAKTSVTSNRIIEHMSKKGFVIGSGYGPYKENHIRIANFPTHSKEQIEMVADELLTITD